MSSASVPPKAVEPGHYGAGYGEESNAADPAAPPPELESTTDAPAGLEPLDPALDPDVPARDDGGALP